MSTPLALADFPDQSERNSNAAEATIALERRIV
jgi:hypothetical protein